MSKKRVPIDDLLAASNQGDGGDRGLKCPKCHCIQFRSSTGAVRNTLKIEGGIKRYRTCRACGHVFCTMER
jgi:hypothetical protein